MGQILLFVFVALLAGTLSWWTVDREVPVHFIDSVADQDPVPPGGELRILHTVNRIRACHVTLEEVLFDAARTRYPLEDRDFIQDPGPLGEEQFRIPVMLPTTMSEGPARYRATRSYICNPMHNFWPIVVATPDVPFSVEK